MSLSFADMTSAVELASRVDTHPLRLAGRALGLSPAEQTSLPRWAILSACAVVGFTGAVLLLPAALPDSSPGRRIAPRARAFE